MSFLQTIIREKFTFNKSDIVHRSTVEQMQTIMEDIAVMARKNSKVIDDSVRVIFTEFSQNALILRARIYIDESDFGGYLQVVGELNLEIMKIVQNSGTQFAQGAQTIMLEQASTVG